MGLSFSSLHLKALLCNATDHFFCAGHPLGFYHGARARNPVPSGLATSIYDFVTRYSQRGDKVLKLVASALLLDAYPPGMHSELTLLILLQVSNYSSFPALLPL